MRGGDCVNQVVWMGREKTNGGLMVIQTYNNFCCVRNISLCPSAAHTTCLKLNHQLTLNFQKNEDTNVSYRLLDETIVL